MIDKIILDRGNIEVINNMLIVDYACLKSFSRKKRYFNLKTCEIRILKFTRPKSIFVGGILQIQIIKKYKIYEYAFVYGKKESDKMSILVSVLENNKRKFEVLTFIGKDGMIDLYDNKISIIRSRNIELLSLHGIKGDKDILLDSITAIQLMINDVTKKSKDKRFNGYIQFTIKGGNEGRRGLVEAIQDENTLTFTNETADDFRELKNLIFDRQILNNGKSKSDFKSESTPIDKLEYLEKLGVLKDKNYITEEEYNLKKKEFLDL